MKRNSAALRLTQLALLCALSVIIGLFKFPIIPIAPYLEFDFADSVIIIGSLLFGALPGLSMLFVVSFIQGFFLAGNGIIGMVMHFIASGSLIIVASLVYRTKRNIVSLILGLVLGTLTMTAVMVPLNYLFTPLLFPGVTVEQVTELLLPALLPFNLIKAGANSALAMLLFRLLIPAFEKYNVGEAQYRRLEQK